MTADPKMNGCEASEMNVIFFFKLFFFRIRQECLIVFATIRLIFEQNRNSSFCFLAHVTIRGKMTIKEDSSKSLHHSVN